MTTVLIGDEDTYTSGTLKEDQEVKIGDFVHIWAQDENGNKFETAGIVAEILED